MEALKSAARFAGRCKPELEPLNTASIATFS